MSKKKTGIVVFGTDTGTVSYCVAFLSMNTIILLLSKLSSTNQCILL